MDDERQGNEYEKVCCDGYGPLFGTTFKNAILIPIHSTQLLSMYVFICEKLQIDPLLGTVYGGIRTKDVFCLPLSRHLFSLHQLCCHTLGQKPAAVATGKMCGKIDIAQVLHGNQ